MQIHDKSRNGSTYPLEHFLGNFRGKTEKVPTRTVSRKLPKISRKVPKKLTALLPLEHFRKGNFLDSWKFSRALLPLEQLRMGNFSDSIGNFLD